jgi:hypothetical protein
VFETPAAITPWWTWSAIANWLVFVPAALAEPTSFASAVVPRVENDPVTRLELLIPNVSPFESTNRTVPVVAAVCDPAAMMLTPSPAPPPAGTETTTDPPVTPTEAMPAPAKVSDLASCVPLVPWVVFEVA